MTILSSIYASTTSLFSFSRALDLISNNVANLNTIGFRGSDPIFESIAGAPDGNTVGALDASPVGEGTQFVGQGRRFAAGEIRQTGNSTDLAINGDGFFILNGTLGTVYTRSGQFQLNADGKLIDPLSGEVVQAFQNGQLSDLVIDLNKANPASPTKKVTFAGTLSTSDTTYTGDAIAVIGADGISHKLTVSFTRDTSAITGQIVWRVSVQDERGVTLTSPPNDVIQFSAAGNPVPGFSTIDVSLGFGSSASPIELNFGSPDGLSGVQSTATTSAVTATPDGYGAGKVASYSFDASGTLTLKYSNGQTEAGAQIALASFANPEDLFSMDGRLFSAADGLTPVIGKPSDGRLGALTPQSVELANVELAKEFADIIILQRGYQASSQILNVSSEMIQNVYNSVSGNR